MDLGCGCEEAQGWGNSDCPYLTAAYIFAGLSMMLNIRLAYSSAPYALIRFKLPENLFSVFVRRMASALELWCLPSMLLGNFVDTGSKLLYINNVINPNSVEVDVKDTSGSTEINKITNVSGPENKSKSLKLKAIIYPSIVTMWLDFITYLVLLYIYLAGGDQGRVTAYYGVIAVSGFVFGINMTLLYAADWQYIPVYIAGENSFPAVTSLIHYITTLIYGNRRKWNTDYIVVCVDICVAIIISFTTAILWTVSYVSTHNDSGGSKNTYKQKKNLWHILPTDKETVAPLGTVASPTLMVIVGMGLVYAIYPGIAPGMIVPFYLVDKIEMVLLVATFFPPVIVAMLNKFVAKYSPKSSYQGHDSDKGFGGWLPYKKHVPKDPEGGDFSCKTAGSGAESPTPDIHNWFWHLFDILIVIKILLAAIFIYSLHYRDSNLSRAIINQPKMSTFLSITFYMCHEILLALGFPGIIGNRGADYVMLPAQYVGALFMIFLAFYSEGYIIEYKSHDPAHWPTEGMTPWNAFCYCRKIPIKITIRNLK